MNGKEWELYRIRDDRAVELERGSYFGNDFNIAESIWQSYDNPVELKDLYDNLSDDYFKESDNQLYKLSRNFNSYVKSTLLSRHKTTHAIDLASGKGQDINRYTQNGFKHVLFIDIDKTALQELVHRKQTIRSPLRVSTLHTNLLDDPDLVINRIKIHIGQVPLIVLNFAIHYLVENVDRIDNLIKIVDTMLMPGGSFIFTCFNGDRIHKLLQQGDWNIRSGEILKYSIKKKYQSSSLEVGQKIDVILPFTRGEYYEENLVDIKYIINKFQELGYKGEATSFEKFIPQYKGELEPDDKLFVSLYSSVVLKKSGKIKTIKESISDQFVESISDDDSDTESIIEKKN